MIAEINKTYYDKRWHDTKHVWFLYHVSIRPMEYTATANKFFGLN
jgi:hypothetical protein